MKTLLLLGATLMLAVSAFATGPINIDTPQSGLINFTNGGSQSFTNQFVVNFSHPPVMTFYLTGGNTNALPYTNTVITTSNFILQSASNSGASTNATFFWTANTGFLKWQMGTNNTLAASATNVAFITPYTAIPFVDIQSAATNSPIAVTAITLTNFTVNAGSAEGFNWQAWGVSATSGTWPATY